MTPKERIREPISGLARPEYLEERVRAGWRLAGLEWERDAPLPEGAPPSGAGEEWIEEIPYGLRVSDDGARLVSNPLETEVIVLALDMIVEDCPLSRVADRLNDRGCRMRDGELWTPGALFQLLPRMIQVGPRIFASEEWMTRRARLPKAAV